MKFKTFIAFLALKSITEDQFNEKTDAEKLELQREYSEDLRKTFEDTVADMANKSAIEGLEAKLDAAVKSEDFDAVKKLAQDLEKEIAALKETPKNVEETPKSLFGALKAAFTANKDALDAAATDKQEKPFMMQVKAAVTVGVGNTVEAAGSASQVSITQNSGIISALRKRVTRYLGSGISIGSLVGNSKVMWMEELDEQGNPVFIGEGDTKTQLSVRYEERDKRARKIGVHAKVTTEMMRNLPSLINYIQNNLLRRVDIATENQLFNGDDTGNNLAGILGYATAFSGGGLTTASPAYADVFRAIALQGEKAHGMADTVFVRPEILAEMDVEKTDDGHYLMPPFRSPLTGNTVAGIRLISTTALNDTDTPDIDFVGGDLSVVNVLFSDTISVQIGLDGNDFTKNLKTILVEQELVQFVSANDTQVLVKGKMSDALATITAS